ncbi:docking protein 2-like [Stigmatopora argus]
MDVDVKKEGNVYLQQHRFGKKWKSMWCVLFRESSSSISRLELWEIKDGGDCSKKKQRAGHKNIKVIRLSDLVRVSTDVRVEACPADSTPFLLETVDKVVVLAAHAEHVADWTTTLCQLAFPVSWEEQQKQWLEQEGMKDNALYSSTTTTKTTAGGDFQVRVRPTRWSEQCGLHGNVVLRASVDALHLLDARGVTLLSWPYKFLRRYGRDKTSFAVEAGRRCVSGEGNFEFDTKEGHALFRVVEAAIGLQRTRRDPSRKVNLPPLPAMPHGHHGPSAAQVAAGFGDLALDAAYSKLSLPAPPTYSEATGTPRRLAGGKDDHIYDEPRVKGTAAASEYDAPEELMGEAWRVMATPDDPRSSLYAVPKRAEGSGPILPQGGGSP